jgi:hypothetical protein
LTGPNPLVILQQEIDLQTAPGLLRVRERLIIDNPTHSTYVGRAEGGQEQPVTLQLNIPADFQRVTFDHEFFGRRFSVVDGKLATGIPWTPGRRELAFTYTLRNQDACRVWRRPLDLPCQQLSLRVDHHTPREVSANLPAVLRRAGPIRAAVPANAGRGPSDSCSAGADAVGLDGLCPLGGARPAACAGSGYLRGPLPPTAKGRGTGGTTESVHAAFCSPGTVEGRVGQGHDQVCTTGETLTSGRRPTSAAGSVRRRRAHTVRWWARGRSSWHLHVVHA